MTLQSVDRLETPCKFCTFAQFEGRGQTGCLANRLESQDHFEAYDEELEFYVIEGLCTTYRPKTWNGGVPDVSKADAEANFKATIIIDYDSSDFQKDWYFSRADQYVKENTIILIVAENLLPQTEKMDILKKANELRSSKWEVNVVFINEVSDSIEFTKELIRNIKTPVFIRVAHEDNDGIQFILEGFRTLFKTRKDKKVYISTLYASGVLTAAYSNYLNYNQENFKGFWDSYYRFTEI
jgi:hypothetical protein